MEEEKYGYLMYSSLPGPRSLLPVKFTAVNRVQPRIVTLFDRVTLFDNLQNPFGA